MGKQLHNRLSDFQARYILSQYDSGSLSATEASAEFEVSMRRFFDYLKQYRDNPEEFTLAYARNSPTRIPPEAEQAIEAELRKEQALIADKDIPIRYYNYSSIRDLLLEKHGLMVSLPTIISRAKKQGYYLEKPPARPGHTRQVLTSYAGELLQHDSSIHRWSPFTQEKWVGITTLDDYSRLLLHGDMVEAESSWAHIQAGRLVMEHYGVPVKYYADQHSIFRFVQNRDSNWRKNTLFTDDTDPQWKQVIIECGSSVTYALSPQAKGKIERPYQWLQDRVVRTCAKEQIKDFKGAREVFRSEVKRYNTRTVHSTTGEIPIIRFEKAVAEGKSLFRPFTVPEPFLTPEDIFCFRVARIVDGYRKISLNHVKLAVPRAPIHSEIQLRILPRPEENSMEVRMWWNETFLGVHTVSASDLPLERITGL